VDCIQIQTHAVRLTNCRLLIPRCPGGQSLDGCAGPWSPNVCASFDCPRLKAPCVPQRAFTSVFLCYSEGRRSSFDRYLLTVVTCLFGLCYRDLIFVVLSCRVVTPQSHSPPNPPSIDLILYPTLIHDFVIPLFKYAGLSVASCSLPTF
jgi:hypothetical protein